MTPRPIPRHRIQAMTTAVGIPEGHGGAETRNQGLLARLKRLLKHR